MDANSTERSGAWTSVTYLLIDRFDEHGPTATLFTQPQNGAYKHAERVPFGDQVKLPEPFDAVLDTSAFPG
ncbi:MULTISPECIES: hypothetical protein [unclassified Streptomyces]|uniref:hypothetical protein n=1 Tax=unclassified Streptomyces TaxID=2593676 RepID=UPI00365DD972